MAVAPEYIGLDVSKDTIDVASYPHDEHWRVTTSEADLAALVAQVRARAPALVVVEATGGYEMALVRTCWRSSPRGSNRRRVSSPTPPCKT